MSVDYESAYTYDTGEVTYWGATYADEPVPKVEIDLSSTYFVLIEDLETGGVIQYETGEQYDTGLQYDGTGSFTDVTDYVKRIGISRGKKNFSYEHFEAGTAQIEIEDPDSRFMPSRTTSPYYPNVVPMRPIRISAEWSGGTTRLFRGYIDSWDILWEPNKDTAKVTVSATDAFKVLSKFETEFTGTDEDSPGTRIENMLDDKSWPAAFRDIDFTSHAVTLVADTSERRSFIQTIQDIEFADQGAFYIDGEGKVVWKGRGNTYPYISALQNYEWFMSDGAVPGGAVTYRQISLTASDDELYNYVSITNPLGNEQISTDKTSNDTYQERSLIRTDVLVFDDTQAKALADFILVRDKLPQERINSITYSPRDSVRNAEMMMGADFFDILRIIRGLPSPTNTQYSPNVYIIGFDHDITPTDWRITVNTRHQATDETINKALEGVPPKP